MAESWPHTGRVDYTFGLKSSEQVKSTALLKDVETNIVCLC